ncbi:MULTISPECIES: amino acid ABC transporter substrate-binding protein [Comamonas]|jgi:glutamate/aspartate transport system substrate-binding protein|uniref:Amino acid ABC transporter substrate-binding protein n=1 Tax=Comamonas sediminis TaxID=1783360 RepID=A0ABV4B1R6_9BURK|nr:amino acid ABC transporter substrate-binding protein [Comamonas sp.]
MWLNHIFRGAVLLCLASSSLAQTPLPDSWDKIKESQRITVGYRPDGLPFAYEMGETKKPVGYAIEICQALIAKLQQSMGLARLDIQYRAINGQTRFTDLASGAIDVDCSNTTNTKDRRESKHVSFSLPYYIAGVRMLVRSDSGINDVDDLSGKRVITTKGTTSLQVLERRVAVNGLKIQHSECLTHDACFKAVQAGTADVWLMDDILLAAHRAQSEKPEQVKLIGKLMSIEPLSLMMRDTDVRMKKVFDAEMRVLSQNFEITRLYKKWFESPLPGKSFALNVPMSYLLTDMLRFPSDKFDN